MKDIKKVIMISNNTPFTKNSKSAVGYLSRFTIGEGSVDFERTENFIEALDLSKLKGMIKYSILLKSLNNNYLDLCFICVNVDWRITSVKKRIKRYLKKEDILSIYNTGSNYDVASRLFHRDTVLLENDFIKNTKNQLSRKTEVPVKSNVISIDYKEKTRSHMILKYTNPHRLEEKIDQLINENKPVAVKAIGYKVRKLKSFKEGQ